MRGLCGDEAVSLEIIKQLIPWEYEKAGMAETCCTVAISPKILGEILFQLLIQECCLFLKETYLDQVGNFNSVHVSNELCGLVREQKNQHHSIEILAFERTLPKSNGV